MATSKPKTAGPATQGLKIVSRPASFYRAGRQFTSEPTTIPLSQLTPDQVEALKGEPNLVVTEVDIEPADDKT